MHPIEAKRHGIARTEVVSQSAAQVESKGEVLSLRIRHPQGAFRVDVPEADAPIEVRGNPPVPGDEVAPHAHHVSEIVRLSAPRNRDRRSAELKIPIAP